MSVAEVPSRLIEQLVRQFRAIADLNAKGPDYIFEPKNGSATRLELFGNDGQWFIFVADIVRLEPGDRGDDDLQAMHVAWALATGGAARYRIGWRKRWIIGDHAALAQQLSPRRTPKLLELRPPWDDSGSLNVPAEFAPLPQRSCVY